MFLTKKIQAEMADYQQRASRCEAIQDAMASAMATIEFSPDGLILEVNDLFLEVIGYHRDEVVGKHHSLFCDPEYARSGEYQNLLGCASKRPFPLRHFPQAQ
jgi:methyl-accepting chemotaxis protein